jgi:tryptophan-rich sensory protein
MNVVALILFVIGTMAVGALGGMATSSSVNTWYQGLVKPAWNPPSWLFAPVWTVLYVLMGVAAWKVWLEGKFWGVPGALFALQLALNFGWSWLFFGQRRPDLALVEIVVLWVSILAMILSFRQVSGVTQWLLLPYILWVTFAGYLNFTLWSLNRGR